nr:HDIG domain-containing protein [Desulfobulbaceae bacterium]
MLDNIRAHSLVVGRVAEFIATALHRNGQPISVELVLSAALLHDIAKTACLHNGEDHASVGHDICLKHGYPELAPIVRQHVILIDGFPQNPITEKEIVYYADKRVKHDQIVSLESRQQYIIDRYGLGDARRHDAIKRNFQQSLLIEQELFAGLECNPAGLSDCLERSPDWLPENEKITECHV